MIRGFLRSTKHSPPLRQEQAPSTTPLLCFHSSLPIRKSSPAAFGRTIPAALARLQRVSARSGRSVVRTGDGQLGTVGLVTRAGARRRGVRAVGTLRKNPTTASTAHNFFSAVASRVPLPGRSQF